MFLCFQILPKQSYWTTYSHVSQTGIQQNQKKDFQVCKSFFWFVSPTYTRFIMRSIRPPLCASLPSPVIFVSRSYNATITRQVILCLVVSEYPNSPLQAVTVLTSVAITQMSITKVKTSEDCSLFFRSQLWSKITLQAILEQLLQRKKRKSSYVMFLQESPSLVIFKTQFHNSLGNLI